jgi:hypothetical protein
MILVKNKEEGHISLPEHYKPTQPMTFTWEEKQAYSSISNEIFALTA